MRWVSRKATSSSTGCINRNTRVWQAERLGHGPHRLTCTQTKSSEYGSHHNENDTESSHAYTSLHFRRSLTIPQVWHDGHDHYTLWSMSIGLEFWHWVGSLNNWESQCPERGLVAHYAALGDNPRLGYIQAWILACTRLWTRYCH